MSLVPSLTQTLCEAGLKSQIVGMTSFCVDPPDLHRKATVIGGTKDPDIELIRSLKPTHILGNEEENKPGILRACSEITTTLITFPKAPTEVAPMFAEMSSFLDDARATKHLKDWSKQLEADLERLAQKKSVAPSGEYDFLYLIWRNPWMGVGQDTYISRSLALAGFRNVLTSDSPIRYPSLTPDQIVELNPTHIFFSSEPYPFRMRDLEALRQECPKLKIGNPYWIDGKLLSWFGTETLRLMSFLKQEWPPQEGDHLKCWNND